MAYDLAKAATFAPGEGIRFRGVAGIFGDTSDPVSGGATGARGSLIFYNPGSGYGSIYIDQQGTGVSACLAERDISPISNGIPWWQNSVKKFSTSTGFTFDPSKEALNIRSVQIAYVPDQTNFDGTIIYGTSGGSLSHTASNEGYWDTVVGINSGDNLSTGTGDTLLGNEAGFYLATGDSNTLLGRRAGHNLISGDANTLVGYNAGYAIISSGSYVVAVGFGAGYQSGNLGTHVGYYAGQNATGLGNVTLGTQAGQDCTGNYNVLLGYNAGDNASANGNKLFIANTNTTTPLIYGEFDNAIIKFQKEGDISTLWKAAQRQDSPVDTSIAFWNDTDKKFDTDANITWDGAQLAALAFSGDGSNLTSVGSATASELTIQARVSEAGGITKGQAVYISGATGQIANVSLADNTDTIKEHMIGLAAETKINGQQILIRLSGEITGTDTATPGWSDGDDLWLSTSGNLTKTKPTSGAMIRVGNVSYSHASNGKIVVTKTNYHYIVAPANEDIDLRMGDSVGSTAILFEDYGDNTVAKIDSNGVGWFPEIRAYDSNGLNIYNDAGTDGLTINDSGEGIFSSNLTVSGNLIVSGTLTSIETENTLVKDNLAVLNKGETGSGVTSSPAMSGWDIDRGTANPYRFAFQESDDLFRIGEYYVTLPVSSVTNGPFVLHEQVLGNTSGAIGYIYIDGGSSLTLKFISGAFTNGETITTVRGSSETTATAGVQVITNSTQAVATREDSPSGNGIAFWSAGNSYFDTDTNLTWNGSVLGITGSASITGQLTSTLATGTAPFVVASNTLVTNLNADLLDGQEGSHYAIANNVLLKGGTVALTANWDAGSFKITAETFESDVATGTSPLTVASTTLVTNLNADLWDGNQFASYLDQTLLQASSPTFVGLALTGVLDSNNTTDAGASWAGAITTQGGISAEKKISSQTGITIGTTGDQLPANAKLYISSGSAIFGGNGLDNTQGLHLLWNQTVADGATTFLNHHGGGTGGYKFYDTADATIGSLLATLSPVGLFHSEGGLEIDKQDYFYYGDPSTNGSQRYSLNASDKLIREVRTAGSWGEVPFSYGAYHTFTAGTSGKDETWSGSAGDYSVTRTAAEHGLTFTNPYDIKVVCYELDTDYIVIQPSKIAINSSGDVSITMPVNDDLYITLTV